MTFEASYSHGLRAIMLSRGISHAETLSIDDAECLALQLLDAADQARQAGTRAGSGMPPEEWLRGPVKRLTTYLKEHPRDEELNITAAGEAIGATDEMSRARIRAMAAAWGFTTTEGNRA